jgi:hypothetical protein
LVEASLRENFTVITDGINPIQWTRDQWTKAAEATGARLLIVEVICSDQAELSRRLEEGRDPSRVGTPRWVPVARGYQPWEQERIVIDTATMSVDGAVAKIREAITLSPPP